jgi:hypothetical protein
MAVLTFVLHIINVQLCKLRTLSFDRTQGSDFMIKLTLNAKGVRSSASCYQLINFGTERNECPHRIVHVNLITKFDDTSLFAGEKNFQLLRCCRKTRQQNFAILVTQKKLWVVVARLCQSFFDPHFCIAESIDCVHFSTIPSYRG